MKKPVKAAIQVQGAEISILNSPDGDFISLTDMLKAKNGDFFISDWLRNRNTIEFLGIWESINNPNFNSGEFATIKSQAGLNRTLSKLNYRIHTDAIKSNLIPPEITPAQAAITYASEADLLNVALVGLTAKQWRDTNPKLDGNMRDNATIEQLLVLANLESLNAEFIHMQLPPATRLIKLNAIAIRQMHTLTSGTTRIAIQ